MNAFSRRGACPALSAPMQTGDGLLVRLNPVAGGLSPAQLIGLAEAAQRHGSGMMEVTARGSIQIRGLNNVSARLLADEVDSLGIEVRTGVPVETGPLAGLDPAEIADPRPLAEAIRKGISDAGLSARLGPKVSVVVDGGGLFAMDDVIADVRLAAIGRDRSLFKTNGGGTRLPDFGSWGLSIGGDAANATVLGAVSHNDAARSVMEILSRIAALGIEGRARDLDLAPIVHIASKHENSLSSAPPSVLPDISPTRGEIDAPRLSPISNFADDAEGAELPISPLVGEMSGRTDGGAKERLSIDMTTSNATTSTLGLIPLRGNATALAIALPFGSMAGATLAAFAAKAEALGAHQIRPALGRTLIVLGLSGEACDEMRNTAAALGFVTDANDPRRFIAACPGAPACASGLIATRAIAGEIAEAEAGFLDGSFMLHVSGCAKGCGHPTSAVLTLVGGENGAGLVVDGTAKTLAAGYLAGDKAARGIGRIAAAVRGAQKPGETVSASLHRLGAATLDQAYRQEL